MNILDLFSGIGAFSLGFHRASPDFKTIAFCEIDDFASRVLLKHWPNSVNYTDIRNLTYKQLCKDGRSKIDVICGGFPCPAFSRSGKQGGFAQDDLFYELLRLIKECNPKYIVLENVEGITKWAEEIRREIKAIGYEYEDAILDARDFGIPQARRRYFGIGVRNGVLPSTQHLWGIWGIKSESLYGIQSYITNSERWGSHSISTKEEWRNVFSNCKSSGIIDGVPDRMDRLRCLGNSICPQIPEYIGNIIIQLDKLGDHNGN